MCRVPALGDKSAGPMQASENVVGTDHRGMMTTTPKKQHHAARHQQFQRYIVEIQAAPPRFIVRDFETNEPLVELDEEATKRCLALSDGDVEGKFPEPAERLRSMAAYLGNDWTSLRLEPPHLPDKAQQAQAPILEKNGRRKLWDLPKKLHCPIIGTCLDVDELHNLCEKPVAIAKRLVATTTCMSASCPHRARRMPSRLPYKRRWRKNTLFTSGVLPRQRRRKN